MRLLFGELKGQTEESKEVYKLFKEYEEKLNDSFSTEPLIFSDKEYMVLLKYCIDNNVKMNTLIPGLNEYEEGCDY